MTRSDERWIKAMEFGHRMGCHQMPERSFFFNGYQFPVCARCTGVLIGEIIAIIAIICGVRLKKLPIIGSIGVMGVDWGLQWTEILSSTNPRRLITGILCGIGLTYVYFYIIRMAVCGLKRSKG